MGELDQYFYISSRSFWTITEKLLQVNEDEWRAEIKEYFGNRSKSRHATALSIFLFLIDFLKKTCQ